MTAPPTEAAEGAEVAAAEAAGAEASDPAALSAEGAAPGGAGPAEPGPARPDPTAPLPDLSVPLSAGGPLLEALEPDGSVVDALIIAAGDSANGRRYRADVLREAAERGVFDGVRAFASDGPDHDPAKRGVRALVGWWSDTRYGTFEAGQGAVEGVAGHFHISEAAPWLRALTRHAFAAGKRDLYGFSLVGQGPSSPLRHTGRTGRPLREVVRIDLVESVDPVIHPAAGGQALRLVASEEEPMDQATATAEPAAETTPAPEAPLVGPAAAPLPSPEPPATPTAEAQAAPVPAAAPSSPSLPDVAALVEAAVAPLRTASLLEARLAARTGLPAATVARIRALVGERALSPADLDGLIEAEVAYAAALNPATIRDAGPAVGAVRSPRDQLAEALDAILERRAHSLREVYVAATGDAGMTGRMAEGRLTESIDSTTFANLTLDSVHKRMLAEYRSAGLDDWRRFAEVVALADFKTQHRVRYGGYGNLPVVAERAAYNPLTTPTDSDAIYAPAKRGGTEDLSLEAIANDDVGAFRRIPTKLARAAAHTLREFVLDFIAANPVIYDGTALFAGGHNNTGVAALDSGALIAARKAIRSQTEPGSAKKVGLRARTLLVPIDLEQTAWTILNTDKVVGSGNNDASFAAAAGMDLLVVDYWTDANNWYVVADPADAPFIEVGFFRGQEEPELFLQDEPTAGNVFAKDVLTYKVRHIYGGAVVDYRPAYGSLVA